MKKTYLYIFVAVMMLAVTGSAVWAVVVKNKAGVVKEKINATTSVKSNANISNAVANIVTNQDEQDAFEEDRDTAWTLPSKNVHDIEKDIVPWANDFLADWTSREPLPGEIPEIKGPYTFVKKIEFATIPIPENRNVEGYDHPRLPTYYGVYILIDGNGIVRTASVESYSKQKDHFDVRTIGPAMDHTPAAYASGKSDVELGLTTWPRPEATARVEREGGKPVLIPYPYVMDQTYYQYGSDPLTAEFEDLESGVVYHGLNAVFDDVERVWNSLR